MSPAIRQCYVCSEPVPMSDVEECRLWEVKKYDGRQQYRCPRHRVTNPKGGAVSNCQHLKFTGKWEPSKANAGQVGLGNYSTLGAFVYRCDDCGAPWTGGVYMTQPPPALTDEEREERAFESWHWSPTNHDPSLASLQRQAFKAGYLAALKGAK